MIRQKLPPIFTASPIVVRVLFVGLLLASLAIPQDTRNHILSQIISYTSGFHGISIFALTLIESIAGVNNLIPAGNIAFLTSGSLLQQQIVSFPVAILTTLLSSLVGYSISFGIGYAMKGAARQERFTISKAALIFSACIHPNIGSFLALGFGTIRNIDWPSFVTFAASQTIWNTVWLYLAFAVPRETMIHVLTDTRILIAYIFILLLLIAKEVMSIRKR